MSGEKWPLGGCFLNTEILAFYATTWWSQPWYCCVAKVSMHRIQSQFTHTLTPPSSHFKDSWLNWVSLSPHFLLCSSGTNQPPQAGEYSSGSYSQIFCRNYHPTSLSDYCPMLGQTWENGIYVEHSVRSILIDLKLKIRISSCQHHPH